MANYAASALKLSDTYVNTLPYGVCTSSSSTVAKVVDVGVFSLEAGAMVVVQFNSTNLASDATLNVSSTGAKLIKYRGQNIEPYCLQVNTPYLFVYTGTFWYLIGTNAYTRAGYSDGLIGKCATIEGYGNRALGDYGSAEGYYTYAQGICSHAAGCYTTAMAAQFVIGHYNNERTPGCVGVPDTSSKGATGSAFIIGNGYKQNGEENLTNAFRVDYNGQVYSGLTSVVVSAAGTNGTIKGAFNSGSADYAELFEWVDLNMNNEDRRGYFVTMDGDKIKFASPGDYVLGIISSGAVVLGNNPEEWNGRYLRDEFGCIIAEEHEYEEVVIDEETGEEKKITKTGLNYKQNPEYDPTQEYIERDKRPEWGAVGMLGVLAVRDDGTCQVNGFCTVAEGGIATASETGYRVIKRVNDHIVKVVFR
jgi:hypothetical protein